MSNHAQRSFAGSKFHGRDRRRFRDTNRRPITRVQFLIMMALPFWYITILVFDQAVAGANALNLEPVVTVKVNHQADEDRIRSFFVEPDQQGNISGQISAIEIAELAPIEQSLEVSLIKNGNEIRTSRTDMGRFVLYDVPDDETYTFIAAGQSGFLAYAVRVTPRKLRLGQKQSSNQSFQYVKTATMAPKLPKRAFVTDEDVQIDAAAIPPTFETIEQIIGDRLPSDGELANAVSRTDSAPTNESLEIAAKFTYSLNPDGTFSGRVIFPSGNDENREFSDLNIFLLQEDKQVPGGQTSVERDGQFSLGNADNPVDPGVYALVAAGKDGFAAVSIKLVEPSNLDEVTDTNQPTNYYVSLNDERPDEEFYLPLITDPRDLQYIRKTVQDINRDRVQQGVAEFAPLDPGFGPPIDESGFVVADGGNQAFFGGNRSGLNGRLGTIDRRRLWRRLLVTGGIVAISVDSGGSSPTDESPSTINQ